MRFDTTDNTFREAAMAWLQSLGDETISDLHEVFRLSPGYYPTTLVELWRAEIGRRGLSSVALPDPERNGEARLPVCHPGDYEWRFTFETAHMLLDRTATGLPKDALVAHLGTPTTFMLGNERYTGLRHVLLERNTLILDTLRTSENVYLIDLITDEPPNLEAHAAVVDPPWYPLDTRAFLVATSRICAVGSRIVLCQPTLATRPGIAEERAALLDELPRLGLICRNIDTTSIRYHMPHFEACSLKKAAPGLFVPDDWRTGDVLTFEKVSDPSSALKRPVSSEFWQEVVFGPVRIKLRRTNAPNLGSLVPGDIIDTVSRRDPIRKRVGLWTSGNRVFSLRDPEAIGKLIELCHTDVIQSQFTLRRMLAHARTARVSRRIAQQLFDLLLIELQEHTLRKEA